MKKWFLILSLFILFSFADSQLLLNPSFELDEDDDLIPDNWGQESFNNSFVPGREQGRALKISNNYPKYSIGNQIVKIKDIDRVSISCWIKADDVTVGSQPWKNAKLQVLFYDQKGERLGEYPEVVSFSGSFDWKKVARTLTVPKQAVEMHILPGIWDTTGTAYFDDICLEILQKNDFSDPFNHLSNGDLETLDNWSISSAQNIQIVYPGFQGNGALLVSSAQPEWLYAVQTIKLLSNYKKIKVSGYMKTENIVVGSQPWQLPRLYLEFKDNAGNLLAVQGNDQYPVVVSTKKNQSWQYFEKEFTIPLQAVEVYLMAGLQKAAGQVYFDQLKVNFFDRDNQPIRKIADQQQTDNQWFALNYLKDSYAPSALDAWIPKPAGQFGFVHADKGHFYFQNGQRARFFGVTIYGEDCFPDKQQAENIAKRLAKHGFNLVRLHHLDAVWAKPNIFGNRADSTRKLDKDSLERLDYFIAQLKKQGIYIYLDLLVHRQFLEQDGVTDAALLREGAKVTALFDQRLIELQKEYARQLLTHVNKYTGLRYLDDPVLVMLAIVNENSLFYLSELDWLAKSYLDKLDYQWNLWLLEQYQNSSNLQNAWANHQYPVKLSEKEDPQKFTVVRGKTALKKDRLSENINIREIDTLKFYYHLQKVYFQQMSKFIKDLGFQGVIAGSNHWLNIDADVKSNAILDFIDRHAYWNHPKFGYQLQAVVENKPMVKDPLHSLPVILGSWKILDKPLVISEWNSCWPSDYHQEAALIMTSYALLHDYDALIAFSFSGADYPKMIRNNFDIGAMPNILTQMPVLSRIFFEQKIAKSQNTLIQNIDDEQIFLQINEDEISDPYLPLICQTVRKYQSAENILLKTLTDFKRHFLQQKFNTQDKIWSDNFSFYWDLKKDCFIVDNDLIKAFTGFCDGKKVALNNFEIRLKNKFATVILSTVDQYNLHESNHLLLNVSSRIVNNGMQFNQTRTQLMEYGQEPILIENVSGKVILRFKKPINNAIVYALDVYGYRSKLLPVNITGKELSFELGSGSNSLIYEIELERK